MLTRVGCLKHVEVYQPEADLARYLAKYVACPPIAVRRIVSYDGQRVKYWYKDHKEKSKKFEEVDVFTFIGRMVRHIMPKWFQRVRYFGLEATKSFKKWARAVREGVDTPFGPPPEGYNYRCSQCQHEMKVNEAIIDVEIAKAEFEGTYYEGFMPILGCPNFNRETMEYAGD